MADAQYLIRLDDACPWMDRSRWSAVEAVLDRHGVRPLVGVVPQCADPELRVDEEDPQFWERARGWQAKGWTMGLHGWDHVFVGRARGLVPLNDYTEFAGRPEAEQRDKIRRGWQALRAQGLNPEVWIAPAHTFDRMTLRCLLEETSIRVVSDGLASSPFLRYGFTWLPQQLWRPRRAPAGLWTLCLHPNEMDDEALDGLERFLAAGTRVTSVGEVGTVTRGWGLGDALFEATFRTLRAIKKKGRKAQ